MERQSLKIKSYFIGNVYLSDAVSFKNWKLDKSVTLPKEHVSSDSDIVKVDIQLVRPEDRHIKINTIMDVLPISTKVLGGCGYGSTHTLTGLYFILTGASESGEQFHSFGSSEGYLDEQLIFDRVGTPSSSDLILLMDVTTSEKAAFNRTLMNKVFSHADDYLQQIRDQMKMLSGRDADEIHEFEQNKFTGKPKVAIVKQVSGQGAMYDHMLFPKEPSGFNGGISIIDMNNMPVVLTPNEIRDGVLRSLD